MRNADHIRTGLARRLRRNSTSAETRLWNRLRSRDLGGHKFVRQYPLGPHIVDFACRERRLVVEVDGGQHAASSSDLIRDQWLREHKYRILRFWNNDVIDNMDGVVETIADALQTEAPLTRFPPAAETDLSPQAGRGS